jgi:hypothetical protein
MCSGLHTPTISSVKFVVWNSFVVKEVGLDVHSTCRFVAWINENNE